MLKMLMLHVHPKGIGKPVFGRELIPGCRILKGDLRPGPDGWTEVPKAAAGQILEKNHPVSIIRPDRVAIPATTTAFAHKGVGI